MDNKQYVFVRRFLMKTNFFQENVLQMSVLSPLIPKEEKWLLKHLAQFVELLPLSW